MRRVFAAVYSEIRGLHQSAYILALFAFISQLLALVRDRLLAHHFGASAELDVYYAAFKIPDLLFVLFASVLSVYVLIPFVSGKIEREGDEGARTMLSMVMSVFLAVYFIVATGVWFGAGALGYLLFPGFTNESHTLFVALTRILLLQPLLLGVSSLFGVVTQLGQRFVLYALSPLLYNGGIIAGILFFYPTLGVHGLVWGVVLGALLHVLIQVPFIRRSPLRPTVLFRFDRQLIGTILATSLPRALTLSLSQIVLIAFAGIASGMAAGSVAVFQFAFNLQSVPLAIVGVSYSVAAFPILAQLFSKGAKEEFVQKVETVLRHIVFWTLPIMALAIVVRAQLVRVVLGTGAFDWNDTRLTAATLALFMVSLVAQSINLLIVRAFYAGGNTRTPFVVTMVSTVGTLILSLGLYILFHVYAPFADAIESLLRVRDVPGTEILMLPLGYSLAQIFHILYLLYAFTRTYAMPKRALLFGLMRSTSASLGGGALAYIALNASVMGIRSETLVGELIHGAIASAVGVGGVVFLLYLMRSPELHELWITLRARAKRKKLYSPDNIDTLAL